MDVASVIKTVHENAEKAARLLARVLADFPRDHEICPIGSDRALDSAIITPPGARDPAVMAKLDVILARLRMQS